MTSKILEITELGAIEKLTTPAKKADPKAIDDHINTGIDLIEAFEKKYKPLNSDNRTRAAGISAPQIGKSVNIIAMYYLPEGQNEPVWRIFVNPVLTPTADAQLVKDGNHSFSTPSIRTSIERPSQFILQAERAFDIPIGVTNKDDIRHHCFETMKHGYQEVLTARPLTQEEMDKEGLKNPDHTNNPFMAEMLVNMNKGIFPIHQVPEEQVKALLRKENPENGPNVRATNPPLTSEERKALKAFYKEGRKLFLEQTPKNAGHAPTGNVQALKL